MNINTQLLGETLLSFSQAAAMLPAYRGTGRVDPSTLFRWCARGCKAADGATVLLECVKVGNHWCVSRESIDRFLAAINRKPAPVNAAARTPGKRQRATDQAERKLASAGI